MDPIAMLLVGAAIAVALVFTVLRDRRLARGRAGRTFESFEAEFVGHAASPQAIRAVYEQLQRFVWTKRFPVRADDDLTEVYGIVGEDRGELISALLKNCDCRPPTPDETERLRSARLVGDLVRGLSSLAK